MSYTSGYMVVSNEWLVWIWATDREKQVNFWWLHWYCEAVSHSATCNPLWASWGVVMLEQNMTLFHNNFKKSLTCDSDIEAVGDVRGEDLLASSSYSLKPGLNCACVSSCITLLNISNRDVSWSAGNKAHCCPIGVKQDTISSPWVGNVCPWVVGGIAGESEGHVQLSWDGGQGRRGDHGGSCVRRRGRGGEGRRERERGERWVMWWHIIDVSN